ncbi:hypothetical protein FSP39_014564 [Pinctada imbricata]|uniref:Uncharacterized protein n=1 Tax=Pinctada imbricata TaxID=66713 RepID=A0AA89C5F6_PINIB|nr:hypothetical protein FSP39_014564 [Pinctada imbricata]
MFVLHANNPRAAQNHEIRNMKTSSHGKTVIVKNWETFSINFCMRTTTSVKLTNLRFSHGNRSALFTVILDHGKWMGTYYAPPGKGFENFQDTGEFPNSYDFDPGWHVLKINISDKSSPLALDFIEFNITDQWMTLRNSYLRNNLHTNGSFPAKTTGTDNVYDFCYNETGVKANKMRRN